MTIRSTTDPATVPGFFMPGINETALQRGQGSNNRYRTLFVVKIIWVEK